MDNEQRQRYQKMISWGMNPEVAMKKVTNNQNLVGLKEKSFMDSVGEFGVDMAGDLKQGWNSLTDSFNKRATNFATSYEKNSNLSPLKRATVIKNEALAQGAGLASDIIGDVFTTGLKVFSPEDLEKKTAEFIGQQGKNLIEATNPITGRPVGEDVKNMKVLYDKWAEENPVLDSSVRAAGNVGLVALDLAGLKGAGKTAKVAGEGVIEGAEQGLKQGTKKISSLKDVFMGGKAKDLVKSGGGFVEQAEDAISETILKKYSVGELLNKAIKPSSAGTKKLRKPEIELENFSKILQETNPVEIDGILSLDEATSTAKKSLWNQIEKKISKSDAMVQIEKFKNIVDDIKTDPVLKTTGGADIAKLEALIKNMTKTYGKEMPILDAERFKQIFNAELKNTFGKSDIGEVYTKGIKDINKMVGEELDNALSKVPKEYGDLKKKWGTLRSYSDDIAQRAIVARRQNPSSLVTGFSRIEGISNILSGIVTAKPSLTIKGAGQAILGKVHANMNNSDKLIKEAFNRVRKATPKTEALTNLPKTISGNIGKAPVRQSNKLLSQNKVTGEVAESQIDVAKKEAEAKLEAKLKELNTKEGRGALAKLKKSLEKKPVKKAVKVEVKPKEVKAKGVEVVKKSPTEKPKIKVKKLTKPKKSGSIDGMKTLEAEAKKYKSAEEFVDSINKKGYRETHQIDALNTSPLHKITETTLDDFADEFKRQYGYPSLKTKDFNKLKKLLKQDKDAVIKVYRASPKNELNSGDWVTIDKTYANDIKRQNGGKVFTHEVKIQDLLYPNTLAGFKDLPSLNKWGAMQYNSMAEQNKLREIWNKAHKK